MHGFRTKVVIINVVTERTAEVSIGPRCVSSAVYSVSSPGAVVCRLFVFRIRDYFVSITSFRVAIADFDVTVRDATPD